jgi:PAS domain S-box-containing protein
MEKDTMVFTRIKQLLAPPVFEDEEKTRLSRLLHFISMTCLTMLVLSLFTIPFTTDGPLLPLASAILGILFQLGVLFLLRRRLLRPASLLLASAFWVAVTLVALAMGGIGGPVVGAYVIIILVASLLLGGHAGMGFAALSVAGALGILLAETSHVLPWKILPVKPVSAWITQAAILGTAAGLLWQATRSLNDALERAHRNERGLAESNRELQALRVSLERQVEERTAALRASEAELRALFAAMTDVILVLDAEGRYLRIAPTNPALLYKPPDHLIGKTLQEVFPAAQANLFLGWVRCALETRQPVNGEYSLQIGSQEFWFSAVVSPMLEDTVTWVARDITERKRTEEALQESEARFREWFDDAPVGYHVLDVEGRIVEVNRTELEMLGYTVEEMVGRPAWEFILEQDVARQSVTAKLAELLPPQPLERTYIRKDGSRMPALIQGRYLLDADGKIEGYRTTIQDITERKRAEQLMRQAEQRYRDLFEEAPIMYVITRNQEGAPLIADCNQLFLIALDYTRAEVVGRPLVDFYTPASRAALLEGGYQRALSNLFTTEERELVTRDERVVMTLLRAVSETDAEGRVVGTRAMFTDITERQQAEEALAQERNLLRALIDNVPDIIYVKDVKSRFVTFNPALARLMGVATPDDLMGKTDFDFYPPELAAQYYDDEHTLLQSGQPLLDHEEPNIDAKGNHRWLLTTKVPLRDAQGKIIGLVGMGRDITQLKRTEEALGRQAARLALLNEVGGKIASVLELESVLNTAAHLVQESFGYHHVGLFTVDRERGELAMRARAGEFVALFPLDHRIKLGQGMVGWVGEHGETLLADDVRAEPRYTNFYPDLIPTQSEFCVPIRVGNETVGVLDVQSPQLDSFQKTDVMVLETLADQIAVAIENARLYEAVQRELAERKQAEEQLQHYSAELAQNNEELKRFSYTISHDLRTPLVNLKGFAGELASALDVIRSALHDILPQLDEQRRAAVATALLADVPEAMGFIDASVTRMDHYINALLKLSRLGQRELVLEQVDMEALTQATLETLAYQIEQRQARVTVGPLPEVVADRTSMEQIISNLLNNAVIYLEPGRAGEIEISGERNAEETLFRVSDNGRGIAQEDMDKVFAPFRRAGKQDVPGEGMGLAYAQTLVRRHDGRIGCESEPGVGTTFSFTLPHQLAQGDQHD